MPRFNNQLKTPTYGLNLVILQFQTRKNKNTERNGDTFLFLRIMYIGSDYRLPCREEDNKLHDKSGFCTGCFRSIGISLFQVSGLVSH